MIFHNSKYDRYQCPATFFLTARIFRLSVEDAESFEEDHHRSGTAIVGTDVISGMEL
jgi:hypothetical protein